MMLTPLYNQLPIQSSTPDIRIALLLGCPLEPLHAMYEPVESAMSYNLLAPQSYTCLVIIVSFYRDIQIPDTINCHGWMQRVPSMSEHRIYQI